MESYSRLATGERIRQRRVLLGMTQEELAEKIGRAYKYCQDIERGCCGMSIETLFQFSSALHLSLDYLVYGVNLYGAKGEDRSTPEQESILNILNTCSENKRKHALELLQLFLRDTNS